MRIHGLVAATLALLPTLAQADDTPKRRPGLREITSTSDRPDSQPRTRSPATPS